MRVVGYASEGELHCVHSRKALPDSLGALPLLSQLAANNCMALLDAEIYGARLYQ